MSNTSLDLKEAASAAGVAVATIRNACNTGALPYLTVDRQWQIDPLDLLRWKTGRDQRVLHVLYRMFNTDNELLYVGITKDPLARFDSHAAEKSWWREVSYITVQNFTCRAELKSAEITAIQSERPKFNVVHADRSAVIDFARGTA